MADVLALTLLVGFFALAVGFVRACERIIGPDLEAETTADAQGSDGTTSTDRVAA